MPKPRLSVTIITFNEENNIRHCLESVRWADEIIVVDAFSTDRTADICKEYTDRVITRKWPGHVAQKQFALEQATGDWILSLDADERLSENLADEIRKALAADDASVDGYVFPRRSYYLGRWINHGGWYPDAKLRLVRKGTACWSGVDPHDKLMTDGAVRRMKHDLLHYVYRDISHQLATVDTFSGIAAGIWHQDGKKVSRLAMLVKPLASFLITYFWKGGILDRMPGLIISVTTAYYVFVKHAKLWELQNKK